MLSTARCGQVGKTRSWAPRTFVTVFIEEEDASRFARRGLGALEHEGENTRTSKILSDIMCREIVLFISMRALSMFRSWRRVFHTSQAKVWVEEASEDSENSEDSGVEEAKRTEKKPRAIFRLECRGGSSKQGR